MMSKVVKLAPKAAASPSWYAINARGPRTAEVAIYDDIGGDFFSEGLTAKKFAADIKALGDVERLDVRINSRGGIVSEGIAIYNTLVNHRASVTVYVDGIAASIASAIAMAGDEIIVAESATMMIHEAWGGTFGTAADFEAYARMMRVHNDTMAKLYADRTGNTVEQIKAWFTAEPNNLGTWMDAKTAVERGFATRIAENMRIAASAIPSIAALRQELAAKMHVGRPEAPVQFVDAAPRPHYDAAAARVREATLRNFT